MSNVLPKDKPEVHATFARTDATYTPPSYETPVFHYSTQTPSLSSAPASSVGMSKEYTSDEELTKLAADIRAGLVFTDRHIRQEDGSSMLPMVFLPVAMGIFSTVSKEDFAEIGLIYEYKDKALPREVNGYPVFGSMHLLSKSDTAKLSELYQKSAG